MKHLILKTFTAIALVTSPLLTLAQPSLGSAENFVLFTSNGAMGNTGITHLTGDVGSNSGSSTGFGNVNGNMLNNNGATGAASTDLLAAYNLLNGYVATMFPSSLLGNGQTLNAAIYSISGNTTLSQTLTLDGQNNSGAVFIFKIQGTFSSGSNSKVILINGAQACNVFWKVEGLVSLASGSVMKGNIIANNAAISMSSGANLEGRALSTTGAISVDEVIAYTPIGCGSPTLTGPASPTLGSAACYALLSANGPVSNSGSTYANGDIGTNVGLTTGHNALNVTGTIHPIPDGNTSAASADMLSAYTLMNTEVPDIELLYPAQFGQSLVLTPHTYVMNGAATFVDTLFLNAQNVANAVFLIQVNGALSTSTYAKVALINGAVASNVFWKVEGAVNIDDYTEFEGTIVANNGAIDIGTGVKLNGRALTTNGALATTAMTVNVLDGCNTAPAAPVIIVNPLSSTVCPGEAVTFSVTATGTGLTYSWKNNLTTLADGGNISGATTAVLTITNAAAADVSGAYHVIVSNVTSKDTSSNAALVLKSCDPTGVWQEVAYSGISLYPNPFTGSFSVQNKDEKVLLLQVWSILGEKVLEIESRQSLMTLELNSRAGIYFYRVTNNNTVLSSGKLISLD
jgi:hypothetical protein